MLAGIRDRRIRPQIIALLHPLQQHPKSIGKPLLGELAGCYSLRVAAQQYRVIYTIVKRPDDRAGDRGAHPQGGRTKRHLRCCQTADPQPAGGMNRSDRLGMAVHLEADAAEPHQLRGAAGVVRDAYAQAGAAIRRAGSPRSGPRPHRVATGCRGSRPARAGMTTVGTLLAVLVGRLDRRRRAGRRPPGSVDGGPPAWADARGGAGDRPVRVTGAAAGGVARHLEGGIIRDAAAQLQDAVDLGGSRIMRDR